MRRRPSALFLLLLSTLGLVLCLSLRNFHVLVVLLHGTEFDRTSDDYYWEEDHPPRTLMVGIQKPGKSSDCHSADTDTTAAATTTTTATSCRANEIGIKKDKGNLERFWNSSVQHVVDTIKNDTEHRRPDQQGENYPSTTTTTSSSSTSTLSVSSSSLSTPWPPFEQLVENVHDPKSKIFSNVQFVLDFAIVGFSNYGTSTMMTWLGGHSQSLVFPKEVGELHASRTARFIQRIYTELIEPVVAIPGNSTADTTTTDNNNNNNNDNAPHPKQLPPNYNSRGYKNPTDIGLPNVHETFRTLFPHTRSIIGIRHPIEWFESFYNYRIQKRKINAVSFTNDGSLSKGYV
jgi:hypothetical protein